jgi:hypothetical protein
MLHHGVYAPDRLTGGDEEGRQGAPTSEGSGCPEIDAREKSIDD